MFFIDLSLSVIKLIPAITFLEISNIIDNRLSGKNQNI